MRGGGGRGVVIFDTIFYTSAKITHYIQSGREVGSRVLATLDRFALRAYDEKEQPELKLEGLSESHICM